MAKKVLTTPISAKDLEDIHVGDVIYLTGELTTCRDVAHRRGHIVFDKELNYTIDSHSEVDF